MNFSGNPRRPGPIRPPPIALEGTPGDGLTRVALDVVDGPSLVERVQGGSIAGMAGPKAFGASVSVSRNVCVTPCVFDTPPGTYELRFTSVTDPSRTSQGFINVGQEPMAYRHALGRHRNRAWRGFVGWPVLTLGALTGLGALSMNDREFYTTGDQLQVAVVGVGLTALGVWLVRGAIIDDQAGSGTQWLIRSP